MKLTPVFLKRVALSFVRAFVASLLVFAIGLFQAPEWSWSKSAGIAALLAGLTAGIRAVQHLLEDGA